MVVFVCTEFILYIYVKTARSAAPKYTTQTYQGSDHNLVVYYAHPEILYDIHFLHYF